MSPVAILPNPSVVNTGLLNSMLEIAEAPLEALVAFTGYIA
jgi:hypothetical protein